MTPLLGLTALVLVVLLGSALSSGVEAAMLTTNPVRVHELAGRARPPAGARPLQRLKQRLGRTLVVLVIANNAFNIFGSLMLGSTASAVFSGMGVAGVALPLFSVGLTMLVILLGEILPKAMASRTPLAISLTAAPFLSFLLRLLLPLVLLLERLIPAITAQSELTTDENEIRLLARLGSRTGGIEADEAAMISKVFQLNDLTARDLMIPRVSADTLHGGQSLETAREQLLSSRSSWWIVLGEEVDEILGVASRDQLLTALLKGEGERPIHTLCEPAEFVPEMIRADRLLSSMRRRSRAVRVVVDEFGAFVGVVGADAVLAVLAGWWRRPQRGALESAAGNGEAP